MGFNIYKYLLKYIQTILGLAFALYFLYTLNNALRLDFNVVVGTFLCLLCYFLSVLPFINLLKRKGKPRLVDWMRVALFLAIPLDYMKLVNASGQRTNVVFIDNSITNLIDAPVSLLILIVAYISLELGEKVFKLVFENKIKLGSRNAHLYFRITGKNTLLGLLFISTVLQAYLLFKGISGYGSSIEFTKGSFSLLRNIQANLNQVTLILGCYVVFIEKFRNKRYINIFLTLLTFQVILGFVSGMKEAFLTPILYAITAFLIGGGTIKQKYLYGGFILLLLLYPLNNSYRNVINNSLGNQGFSLNKIELAANIFFEQPLSEILTVGAESYGNRVSMYGYFDNSIKTEAQWTYYKHMNRYLVLPIIWLVPRSLWPNKPRSDVGAVYNDQLVGRTTNSITPTNVGWAYFEGGTIYVVIIFVIIGLFFSKIDSLYLGNPLMFFLFAWGLHKALKPEWDPYFMLSSAIQSLVMCWLLLKIFRVKKYFFKRL